MSHPPRYWYSAPQFGFGYRQPLTWEGWVVDLSVCALFAAAGLWIRRHPQAHPLLQLGCFFGVLGAALIVHRWKGEPKSWD